MRGWLKAAMVGVVVMGATACSPPLRGVSGLSVDADGHPIIVMAWCDGAAPDAIYVYHDEIAPLSGTPNSATSGDPSATPSVDPPTRSVDDAKFTAPDLQGQNASVRLDAPADGWTVEPQPLVLKPGVTYIALASHGRGADIVNLLQVGFTAVQAAHLTPGQVLFQGWGEPPSEGPMASAAWLDPLSDKVISREEFNRKIQESRYC
ncbi:hypothetical protein [Microbispora sp. NPDC049125]|uniref:hypothetical protein n=1 Tax=Microbispora sp. NPDC049125 TaxID=3154929 RepID=UPI003466BB51